MRKKASLLMFLAVLAPSCERKKSVDPRIEKTRSEIRANMFVGRTDAKGLVRSDVLSALDRSSLDLTAPSLASSLLLTGAGEKERLWVWWIEDTPTIDGVEIHLGQSTRHLDIPTGQLEALRKGDATFTVLFVIVIEVPDELAAAMRNSTTLPALAISRHGSEVGTPKAVRILAQ